MLKMLLDEQNPIYAKDQPLKILHMFYDTVGGVPVVLDDYGYLRGCVLLPAVDSVPKP